MPITTLDEAIAGMKPAGYFAKGATGTLVAGRPFNLNYLAGVPGAMSAPSSTMPGSALTNYAGQLSIPAASGNTHLARFSAQSSAQGGLLLLCDRLWHQSGIAIATTTAQTVSSVAWPARDVNGATSGAGVLIGLEVTSATGTGAATPSISYTNSAGTAGRTSTKVDTYAASQAAGVFFRLGLQAGDVGVQSIQSVTLGTAIASGAISLVAYRVLATLELAAAGIPNAVDALTAGLPRCYDNTVPFLLYVPQTTTTTLFSGSTAYTQG